MQTNVTTFFDNCLEIQNFCLSDKLLFIPQQQKRYYWFLAIPRP